MVMSEVYKWSCDVLGPLHRTGDLHGCKLENGKVTTPPGFKQAWKGLHEAGWALAGRAQSYGGQQGPFTLHTMVEEFLSGANTAFNMYPGLTLGAAEVIHAFGTEEQKQKYCAKHVRRQVRRHDVPHRAARRLRRRRADDHARSRRPTASTRSRGTKIFISGGDHDLTENIVHLVLARTPEAPGGTKGLSLFIVPRDRLDGSGSNDVAVSGIEHKMGINGSATCVLNFGENDNCIGELVGTRGAAGHAARCST